MSNKNQNPKTDEKKDENAQTPSAENPQSEVPAQADPAAQTGTPPAGDGGSDSSDEKKDGNADEKPGEEAAGKTVKLILKHKSHTPHYHRCGLTLTKTFAEYEVPAESVKKLKADKWIVVQESK